MSVAKEAAQIFRTKERIQGAITAFTIVIFILTTVNFIGVVEFRTTLEDKWTSSDARWGFPTWETREYELQITSVGEYGGSIDVTVKKIDGWSFSGTFFVGDTVLIGNYRVILAEINLDRENPIRFQYYSLIDIKSLLVILLAISIIVTVYEWWPKEK